MSAEPHLVTIENAEKVYGWLKDRQGIAIWQSINLSNPGASWTTPVLDENGQLLGKPNWQCGDRPARIITDPAEVLVTVPKEVERFRIAVRVGSQGFSVKLTDHSSKKVRDKVDKWNERRAQKDAYYVFDYSSQEAVILVDDKRIPLLEHIASLQKVPTP